MIEELHTVEQDLRFLQFARDVDEVITLLSKSFPG